MTVQWVDEVPAEHSAWDGPLPAQGSKWAITDLTGLHQIRGSRAPLTAVVKWLDANSGCWALVGTYDVLSSKRKRLTGWNQSTLGYRGFPVRMHEGNVYVQSAHGEAHELEKVLAFLAGETLDGFEWPRLELDPFMWSKTELNKALATAKAWLFPIEGMQAA